MSVSNVLPEKFDGTFRFTNWTGEDFVGIWAKKEYRFPAGTTSPMIIFDQTPIEIQQIRKKFAKDLAEREFYKSQEYKKLVTIEKNPDGSSRLNSSLNANAYTLDDLTPFIQKCLEPLASSEAIVTEVPVVPIESKLTKNDEGQLNTVAVDRKMSLRKKALDAD